MTIQLVTAIKRYIGTAAEVAAFSLTGVPVGSTFFESDTGILKVLNAAGALVTAPGETVALSGSNTGNCVSASVTRPNDTTAYAVGDVVGNTTYLEFANVGVAGQEICIFDITLMIKKEAAALDTAAGGTAYKVYLYTDAPTAIADNAAWALPYADADKYARIIAQTGAVVDRGDVLTAEATEINRFVKLTGTSLYAYLVTDSIYTPVALTVQDLKLHYNAV